MKYEMSIPDGAQMQQATQVAFPRQYVMGKERLRI
jgi:hypothetical protein